MTRYERIPGTPLTPEQRKEIEALRNMPDSEIDFSDAPVLPDSAWANAVRGRFYRPVKKQVTARLDADVIDWLKKQGKGYQSRMNAILRREMLASLKAGLEAQSGPRSSERSLELRAEPG